MTPCWRCPGSRSARVGVGPALSFANVSQPVLRVRRGLGDPVLALPGFEVGPCWCRPGVVSSQQRRHHRRPAVAAEALGVAGAGSAGSACPAGPAVTDQANSAAITAGPPWPPKLSVSPVPAPPAAPAPPARLELGRCWRQWWRSYHWDRRGRRHWRLRCCPRLHRVRRRLELGRCWRQWWRSYHWDRRGRRHWRLRCCPRLGSGWPGRRRSWCGSWGPTFVYPTTAWVKAASELAKKRGGSGWPGRRRSWCGSWGPTFVYPTTAWVKAASELPDVGQHGNLPADTTELPSVFPRRAQQR